MSLLIDGHNLIGQLPDIRLDDLYDEAKLVTQLKAYVTCTGKRVTVVFESMPGGHSDLSSGWIEVVFAATGHTDDGTARAATSVGGRRRTAPPPAWSEQSGGVFQ